MAHTHNRLMHLKVRHWMIVCKQNWFKRTAHDNAQTKKAKTLTAYSKTKAKQMERRKSWWSEPETKMKSCQSFSSKFKRKASISHCCSSLFFLIINVSSYRFLPARPKESQQNKGHTEISITQQYHRENLGAADCFEISFQVCFRLKILRISLCLGSV